MKNGKVIYVEKLIFNKMYFKHFLWLLLDKKLSSQSFTLMMRTKNPIKKTPHMYKVDGKLFSTLLIPDIRKINKNKYSKKKFY